MASSYNITALSIPFAIILTSLLPSPSSSAASGGSLRRPTFKKIYAFGDSYTDTGNTRSSTGPTGFPHVSSLPYGRTFFHRPTNRYSDGRLIIDFVADSLSLPYLPPYVDRKANASAGVNFAVGGCTAISYGFFERNGLLSDITKQSLETQLGWFDEHRGRTLGCGGGTPAKGRCEAEMEDALVWLGEIGANDYAYTIGSNVSSDTIRRLSIDRVTHFLHRMVKRGAKHIVVQGLPPRGCLAFFLAFSAETDRDSIGCAATVNRQSSAHNSALRSALSLLRNQYPSVVFIYSDYFNSYLSVLRNATRYGFMERYKACCGSDEDASYGFNIFKPCGDPDSKTCEDPSRYINWDGGHLTEAMNKILADMFINGTFSNPHL